MRLAELFAVHDAVDFEAVLKAVLDRTGVRLEAFSGEGKARLTYRAAPVIRLVGGPVFDIGGGSRTPR